ncbi:MAG: FAD-dependent oxidoreductase [Gammaproteobacteria bacterium]|nr:FAD-dependent oxidoreductase [Gammaproteobacteria bacterium]
MKNIVIIGTGLAGYLLAKEFRKYDTSTPVTLITKSDGCFYSKPLLSTAFAHQKTPDQLVISDVFTLREQLNATILIRSDVFRIDADNKKLFYRDEKHCEHNLCYEKLVLANGAEKIEARLEGDAVDDVLFVNQLEDYRIFHDKLDKKKDVAILGAGLIACEFAKISSPEYSILWLSISKKGE